MLLPRTLISRGFNRSFLSCQKPSILSPSPVVESSFRTLHTTVMTDQVRVGVGAFVLSSSSTSSSSAQNPTFLIGRRLGSHGAGSYALPGGHLEFGETPEECAAREVLEETGLEVKNVRFLTATNDFLEKEGKHYVTLFVVCERADERAEPRVMEVDKCEGWEWSEWEELVRLVRRERSAREGEVLERRLFQPLLDLVEQKPGCGAITMIGTLPQAGRSRIARRYASGMKICFFQEHFDYRSGHR